jgi:hypothetical protein
MNDERANWKCYAPVEGVGLVHGDTLSGGVARIEVIVNLAGNHVSLIVDGSTGSTTFQISLGFTQEQLAVLIDSAVQASRQLRVAQEARGRDAN